MAQRTKPDFSRLKHVEMLGLFISSIATLGCGFAHFFVGIPVLKVLFALPEHGTYYGTVKLIAMLLTFLVAIGVFAFGLINSLTGKYAKFVEIFHWMEFAMFGGIIFDSLDVIPEIGFPDAFGGLPDFILLVASVVAILALTVFAELTERYDHKHKTLGE